MGRGREQASGDSGGQQPAIRLPRSRGLVIHGSIPNESKGLFEAEYSASPMTALPAEFRRQRGKEAVEQ
jgi:hypothetical protein